MKMIYGPEKHHRRSIRLKGYDYSQAGAYFITICTHNRECLFGDAMHGEIQLNEYGNIVNEFWNKIPTHFSNAEIDVLVVMPNHIHGVIVITDKCRGGITPLLRKRTLGQIVAYFKYQTTKLINQIRNTPGTSIWQRNYYKHIIRNEEDSNQIREYIINNPLKWESDSENPQNIKRDGQRTLRHRPKGRGYPVLPNDGVSYGDCVGV